MSFAIAYDFRLKTERSIAVDEAGAAVAQGCFCWMDIALDETLEPVGVLVALGISREDAERILRADAETPHDIGAKGLHFGFTEAVFRGDEMESSHVRVVVREGLMITLHRGPSECLRRMADESREDFKKYSQSFGFLFYELGDSLLAMHRRGRRHFAGGVEALHDNLLDAADDQVFARVSVLTRNLLRFRKWVLDSGEILHELSVRKSPWVPETTQPYLQSLADAVERLAEDLSVHRDTLNDAVNLYLSSVSHRTNQVVKRLTIVGTIFMPLTFLCGVYGMNMAIPEVEWTGMYGAFWGICLALTIALVWMMRKWKWL